MGHIKCAHSLVPRDVNRDASWMHDMIVGMRNKDKVKNKESLDQVVTAILKGPNCRLALYV